MTEWEEDYIAIRKKEGFLFSDVEVKVLPHRPQKDVNYSKWRIREKSANRLLLYLENRFSLNKHLLDLGCGNGWFSNQLASINPTAHVEAWDVNHTELEQAGRVFKLNNLMFKHQDIFDSSINQTFDFIILNSVVQYFPDLHLLLNRLIELLKPAGEIHLLDSPFYHEKSIEAARKRSETYYTEIGFPQMAAYYYHHAWEKLDGFQYERLYDPSKILSKIKRKLGNVDSPFPWIKICRKNQRTQP